MTKIKWETAESITDEPIALIVGRMHDGRSCVYVVGLDGRCEISEADTDGDYDGEGWPHPPSRYIREARLLALGTRRANP